MTCDELLPALGYVTSETEKEDGAITSDELLPVSTWGVTISSSDATAVSVGSTVAAEGPSTPLTKGSGEVDDEVAVWAAGTTVPALAPRTPLTKGIGLVSEAPTVSAAGLTVPALGSRTPLTKGMTFQKDGLTVLTPIRRARIAASVPAARSRATRGELEALVVTVCIRHLPAVARRPYGVSLATRVETP